MDFDHVLRAANILTPVVVAGVGWLIKNAIGRVTDRVERLEVRQRDTEFALDAMREQKVSREDWVRETTRTTQKLDRLCEGQARIEATMNVAVAVSEAIKELAGVIRAEQGDANE